MTKKTSTPANPPRSRFGQRWKPTTSSTAAARSAWMSGRNRSPATGRATTAGRTSALSVAVAAHRFPLDGPFELVPENVTGVRGGTVGIAEQARNLGQGHLFQHG